MIKIERKETEKAKLAVEALKVAKEKGSSYNTEEVNNALAELFYNKCYICENKDITSCQIEHLIPHRGNIELKYDWNNLFWSCSHCNNIKSDKYEPILDCTKEDVDAFIAFRKMGYFGTEERLEFVPLFENEAVHNTIQLLYDAYYGTTPQKKLEAKVIRKHLRDELHTFKDCVREYQEAEGEDKIDLLFLIKAKMKVNAPFAAFKRWLIKDNASRFPELFELLQSI